MRLKSLGPLLAGGALAALLAAGPEGSAQVAEARYHDTIPGTLVEFSLVRVPGGPATLPGVAHPIEVAPFLIGQTEVTWDMYDVFALGLDVVAGDAGADAIARPSSPYGAPDYGWGHAGYPVMSVTREAAEAFCAWLSTKTGRHYRLPTEAEWQRAADLAAGTQGGQPATESIAWFAPHANRRTHAVASKQADGLGLFDLFGNTAEWVTTSGARVTRGGSYRDAEVGPGARAIQDDSWNERDPQLPKSRWWLSDGPFVGFRLAADLPTEENKAP